MDYKNHYRSIISIIFIVSLAYTVVCNCSVQPYYYYNNNTQNTRIILVADGQDDILSAFDTLYFPVTSKPHQLHMLTALSPIHTDTMLDENLIKKIIEVNPQDTIASLISCLTDNVSTDHVKINDLTEKELVKFEQYVNTSASDLLPKDSKVISLLIEYKKSLLKDFDELRRILIDDVSTNKQYPFVTLFSTFSTSPSNNLPAFVIEGFKTAIEKILASDCEALYSSLTHDAKNKLVKILKRPNFFVDLYVMQILWALEKTTAPQHSLVIINTEQFEHVNNGLLALEYKPIAHDIIAGLTFDNSIDSDALQVLQWFNTINNLRSGFSTATNSTNTSFNTDDIMSDLNSTVEDDMPDDDMSDIGLDLLQEELTKD